MLTHRISLEAEGLRNEPFRAEFMRFAYHKYQGIVPVSSARF